MTTFGVFNLNTYNDAKRYVADHALQHLDELGDDTPASMTYSNDLVMDFPINYTYMRYDAANQYISKHQQAAQAEQAAQAAAYKHTGVLQ